MSYDTTFNLGDYYVSVLLFRNVELERDPIMPLAYAIHERKLKKSHNEIFSFLSESLPDLKTSKNVIMVTDSEEAITSSFSVNFPQIPRFLCHNHILQVN